MLLDLDEQSTVGHRVRGAGRPAVQTLQCDRPASARQPDAVRHLGDRPNICKLLLMPGHKQDLFLVTDVHGQRQRHAREDDSVFQGD
jgi:hypothetical protein